MCVLCRLLMRQTHSGSDYCQRVHLALDSQYCLVWVNQYPIDIEQSAVVPSIDKQHALCLIISPVHICLTPDCLKHYTLVLHIIQALYIENYNSIIVQIQLIMRVLISHQ